MELLIGLVDDQFVFLLLWTSTDLVSNHLCSSQRCYFTCVL